MRYYILIVFLCSVFSSVTYSQHSKAIVKVGDTFIIGETNNDKYTHIHFPKANFIIKKGGIANFNAIQGKKVKVTSIQEDKNGDLIAKIKLNSENYFFNSHKYVTVNIIKAIKEEELLKAQ